MNRRPVNENAWIPGMKTPVIPVNAGYVYSSVQESASHQKSSSISHRLHMDRTRRW